VCSQKREIVALQRPKVEAVAGRSSAAVTVDELRRLYFIVNPQTGTLCFLEFWCKSDSAWIDFK